MKFSSINLNNLALYLKYGIISFPNLTIKKEKKKRLKKIKNINFKKNSYDDVYNCLVFLISKQIKRSKKKNEKVILFLSSGVDSRLLYYIVYNICKNNNYLKNFYVLTGNIKSFNNKYSEFKALKNNFKQKIHKHKVIDIVFKNFEKEIIESCRINQKPINGLPAITMKKLFNYCSNHFKKKIVITGIGDSIFFNANNKIINNLKKNKSIQYASDGIVYKPNEFLTKKYDLVSNKIFKNLKFKKLFKVKSIYHNFILKQCFYLKGPKVKNEVKNLSKYFKVKTFSPFCETRFHEKILGLPNNLLFNGKSKSFVNEMLRSIEGREPKQGLMMNSPQREYLFEKYKNNVIKTIKNSNLQKLNVVESKKILASYIKLQKKYYRDKYKKSFKNFSSYEIWKFISTEFFLRSLK